MNKKVLFILGILFCGIMISGIPAYYISLFGSQISKLAVFFLLWGLFSVPFGIVLLLFLIQWYKEK